MSVTGRADALRRHSRLTGYIGDPAKVSKSFSFSDFPSLEMFLLMSWRLGHAQTKDALVTMSVFQWKNKSDHAK